MLCVLCYEHSCNILSSHNSGSQLRDPLLGYLAEPMETGEGEAPATYRPRSSKLVSGSILPELDIYLHLLVLLQQIDSSKLDKVISSFYSPLASSLRGFH